jgi:DNA-binding HxlR family transcriptional regulator
MQNGANNGRAPAEQTNGQMRLDRVQSRLPRNQRAYSAEKAVELVSDKWTVEIFHALRDGNRRYGEIRRTVPGISKKMLTQTLRKLERDGLVQRTEYDVTPPHVEYSLTPLAESLLPSLTELCRWFKKFGDDVSAARQQYDQERE